MITRLPIRFPVVLCGAVLTLVSLIARGADDKTVIIEPESEGAQFPLLSGRTGGEKPVPGWYEWRGPEQNGVSREKNLPDKWDPDTRENLIWDAPVGGMSS